MTLEVVELSNGDEVIEVELEVNDGTELCLEVVELLDLLVLGGLIEEIVVEFALETILEL